MDHQRRRPRPDAALAFCLMPNHFHLVLWPEHHGDLSRWMHRVQNAHVRRYHAHYHSSGHVWQGRFKAFPVQDDDHLYTVLRYVERNPLRANQVRRAEDWPWFSLSTRSDPPAVPVANPKYRRVISATTKIRADFRAR